MEDPQETMNRFLHTIQIISGMVDQVAASHPEAVQGARRVQEAIETWVMEVVQSPLAAGSEPIPPRIVG